MKTQRFLAVTRLAVPAPEAFAWHARPGALQRLTPPWERAELLETEGGIRPGGRAVVRVKIGPFWKRWEAEHGTYEEGRLFSDRQVRGPFAFWEHHHRFEPDGETACCLRDEIEYALPLGRLGRLFGGRAVQRKLLAMFEYRHGVTAFDLKLHRSEPQCPHRRILVSGSRGLLGSTLVPFLTTGGHEVERLERSEGWNFRIDEAGPADAVVHLAGENIAHGRWSRRKKERILQSRVEGTRQVAVALAARATPPEVFVGASAVGWYGDRGDEELTEKSATGSGFLADVCRQWEAAAAPLLEAGVRVVHLRFGVVLSPRGGALRKMLTPFRMGAGGRVGSGRQYMSWISVDDAAGAVHHALRSPDLEGAVNAVAPRPVTNREFTKILGRVLRRPTIFPLPGVVARAAFGEVADALLLGSQRVLPVRLREADFDYRDPDLEFALRRILGRWRRS